MNITIFIKRCGTGLSRGLLLLLLPAVAAAQSGSVAGDGGQTARAGGQDFAALMTAANASLQASHFEAALTDLSQAYTLATEANDIVAVGKVINAMANVYYNTGQLDQARRHYETLLELDADNWPAAAVTLYNLGHVSASEENYAQAEDEFQRAMLISREIGDTAGEAFALKALGVNAQARHQPLTAARYLEDALGMFELLGDDVQKAHIHRHLGDVALTQNREQAAIDHYLEALPVYLRDNINTGLLRTYRGLSLSYENLKSFDKALITYKAFNTLLQEQLEQQSSELTRRLQVEFDTRRYAEENSELTLINRSQQAELDYRQSLLRKQYLINALTIGVILLVIMLFYRSQQFARKMESLATTDELTGLHNRRAILEHGIRELQRAERFERPLSCLMLDIDHFKSINDTYGHDVGDMVLKKVAAILKSTLRQTDALGRIGGEEFLLIAAETAPEQGRFLAERIRQSVSESGYPEMDGRHVTLSVGIAQLDSEESLEELIKRADKALYNAKHEGRNQVVVCQG